MSNMSDYICVVGGANLDICGYPYAPLIRNDSNPSSITTTAGGVGRNIAHNLSLLGVSTALLTALGDDHAGHLLLEACKSAGIDMSRSLVCDSPTSTYLCINDENGDMALACSDMSILSRMDEQFFAERLDFINSAAACVVDTNLPEEMLKWLCRRISVPVFAETVSVGKCDRLRGALGDVYAVKANLIEARKLSGEKTPENCAQALIDKGVELVFITLGADGVYIQKGESSVRVPSAVKHIVNTTGAGDAFLAAALWSQLRGLGIEETARAGMRASAICVASKQTVSPELCEIKLLEELMLFSN